MHRQSCPRGRAPLSSVPGPIPGRVERPAEVFVPPEPLLPVRPTQEVEMRICRHRGSIPPPATPGGGEIVCQLQRQNELLTDILSAINALTAATLARGK